MNTIKKTLLASCGIAMAMALYACGDDDSEFLSNRDDIESESSSSAGKEGDAKGSSSSVETLVDVQDGPISETDSIDYYVPPSKQEIENMVKKNKKNQRKEGKAKRVIRQSV